MRIALASYPRYQCLAALTLAIVVVSSAITIKDDAAAKLLPPPAQSRSANAPSKLAVANDSSRRTPQASQARMLEAYGKLPLSFEINRGQTDPRVKFLSRGSGYSLFLTANEAVLTLRKGNSLSALLHPISALQRTTFRAAQARQQQGPSSTDAVVRMRLVGANAGAKVIGQQQLPGKSNYFIGNDPKSWRTKVPNYARVKYANLYPGVDLVYYGHQRELEYDFLLAPGADPRQIELSFDGAKRLRLDADGNLIVSIAGGEVTEHKPIIYQDIGRMRRRITGGYALRNSQTVGFKLTRFDDHRSLTIDPSQVYSTYLGGSGADGVSGIALDSAGNANVTGATDSSDFPTTAGAFQTTIRGRRGNAFVSKLNRSGSALVYSTYLGGSGCPSCPYFDSSGSGIALDSSGNAYVTGYTYSSDFPTTAGAFQTTYAGGGDAFVSKLNSSGSALVYSTYLGGSNSDFGGGIALDSAGNAYVSGSTGSSNFPTTAGAFQTTYAGGSDAFVSKLNSSGSALVYSTYLGGSNYDFDVGIALDSAGNAYVTGYTYSSDFPTTAGAFQTTLRGFPNAFVSKLNSSGSALVYSTYLGGSGGDGGSGIALDSAGNAYVTGGTKSSDFPTTAGAFQLTFGGGLDDAFVSKFSFGTGIPFSRFGGGLLIDPDAGVFYLSGGFRLGPGGSIDPSTQPVTFSVDSYSVTLPHGSFVRYKTGYVYQKTVNHIFLCVFIKFTSTPGTYQLLANRKGGTLTSTTSPVPVTLAIGNDNGTAQMKAKFD